MLNPHIDRNKFSVIHLSDNENDVQYWRKQSPQDRISAIEMMRRINYGNDISTKRLASF
ncbi:hypothetical protein GF406_22025 [candidate division KSB1 bacterium]|nr:hypothetical protein [candidate division KSB1 bacterium]